LGFGPIYRSPGRLPQRLRGMAELRSWAVVEDDRTPEPRDLPRNGSASFVARPHRLRMSTPRGTDADPRGVHCPRCGLNMALRSSRAVMAHCPRCIARNRVLVELLDSTLPAGALYAADSLPRADVMSARATEVLGEPSTSLLALELNQRTRAVDSATRARSQMLVLDRPMAETHRHRRACRVSPDAAASGHLPALR
jgi:hypothetical protein